MDCSTYHAGMTCWLSSPVVRKQCEFAVWHCDTVVIMTSVGYLWLSCDLCDCVAVAEVVVVVMELSEIVIV